MTSSDNSRMQGFQHERLDVYRAAIDFGVMSEALARFFRSPYSELADQLRRAAFSIALNIAEGAGEFAKPDKRRFYRFALRSTSECAAIIDLGCRLGLIETGAHANARSLLIRITAMLTAICNSTR